MFTFSNEFSRNGDYISAIPYELLVKILRLTQELSEEEDEDSGVVAQRIPLEVVASHVSVYWRQLVLDTGIFWRQINLDYFATKKIQVYLIRSKQAPLHIRLDLISSPEKIVGLTEKIDLIFSHINRWTRFTMLAETENSELPIVSRLYDEAAPVLEHLNLFVNDVDSECLKSIRRTKSEQILTKGCPLLTVLRMRGLPMHFFCPPLTNITTLYLEQTRGLFLGYRRFVKLLTASPVLAHLSIQASVIDESEESWPPESRDCISVLNLVSLRLAFPGTLQQSFSDVLGSVCAPRLQSLVLKAMGEMQLDNFLASPAVAAAKFPALRSLALCDFDYHSNMRWAAICAAFPHITDFIHFYTTTCPPRILSMLAGLLAEWPSDTWPNLQTLTVTLDIDDLPLVQDAVAHRKKIGHPIPVLRVFETVFEEMNDGDEEILNWLEKNTMVERLMTVDRWPPGSDYDPDDIFVE